VYIAQELVYKLQGGYVSVSYPVIRVTILPETEYTNILQDERERVGGNIYEGLVGIRGEKLGNRKPLIRIK
jgi:hypothetical protein